MSGSEELPARCRWIGEGGRTAVASLLVALVALGTGCRSTERGGRAARDPVRGTDAGGAGGAPPAAPSDAPGGDAGSVSLSDADLAPVDTYVKTRVWYVGDSIEIVASREYFWQNISFVAAKGVVQREDAETPDGLVVTVTYVGAKALLSETTAPRVLIGTGITASARERLVVRFVKTRDLSVPVRLRISATGNASMGRGAEKLRRGETQIVAGCALVRGPDGRWQYREQ
jgi:hypothetical protein